MDYEVRQGRRVVGLYRSYFRCRSDSSRVFSFVFEFEWRFYRFYALSASKAISMARIYSHITYLVRWWWLLDEWNWEETYHQDTIPYSVGFVITSFMTLGTINMPTAWQAFWEITSPYIIISVQIIRTFNILSQALYLTLFLIFKYFPWYIIAG